MFWFFVSVLIVLAIMLAIGLRAFFSQLFLKIFFQEKINIKKLLRVELLVVLLLIITQVVVLLQIGTMLGESIPFRVYVAGAIGLALSMGAYVFFIKRKRRQLPVWGLIGTYILRGIITKIIVGIFLVALGSIAITPMHVAGDAMLPWYQDGTRIFIQKLGVRYYQHDVVAVRLNESDTVSLRWVAAAPGSMVEIIGQDLVVDGSVVAIGVGMPGQDVFSGELGLDEYFVLGINHEQALDSRTLGPIKREDFVGKQVSTERFRQLRRQWLLKITQ